MGSFDGGSSPIEDGYNTPPIAPSSLPATPRANRAMTWSGVGTTGGRTRGPGAGAGRRRGLGFGFGAGRLRGLLRGAGRGAGRAPPINVPSPPSPPAAAIGLGKLGIGVLTGGGAVTTTSSTGGGSAGGGSSGGSERCPISSPRRIAPRRSSPMFFSSVGGGMSGFSENPP